MRARLTDSYEDTVEQYDIHVIWKGSRHDLGPDVIFLADYLEENAIHLRARYLELIDRLGRSVVGSSTVVEYLKVSESASLWWMSPIAEKNNYDKSPYIGDIIRLLALTDLLREKSIKYLDNQVNDRNLNECLAQWCTNVKVEYSARRRGQDTRFYAPLLIRNIIYMALGVGWLIRRVVRNLRVINLGMQAWGESNSKYLFVSYLFNFDVSEARNGNFISKYWGALPDYISKAKHQISWLHLYTEGGDFSNPAEAVEVIKSLNAQSDSDTHIILDAFLSWGAVIRILMRWFVVRTKFARTRESISKVTIDGMRVWPYYEVDFEKLVLGHLGLSGIYHLVLFERAFALCKSKKFHIYPQENQPWEFASIAASKRSLGAKIVGVPHTFVRFWDLRYFYHWRDALEGGTDSVPCPDLVAVNGPVARQEFQDSGYEMKTVRDVEALRFDHLPKSAISREPSNVPRLLVLGDFVAENVDFQLNMLAEALKVTNRRIKIIYKPHPAVQVDLDKYGLEDVEVSSLDIPTLAATADMAFASAQTSAAVDAYFCGLPVASSIDTDKLNMSPLRNINETKFVASAEELAILLREFEVSCSAASRPKSFFWFNDDLTDWRQLLEV